MTRNKTKRSAAPEQYVRSAHVRENQAVVFDDFAGLPLQVTFLDGEWWITSPGFLLQPLKEFFDSDDVQYFYLCEPGGRVGALALAKMLGRALSHPEDTIDNVLPRRVQSLKRLGVTLDVKDETLTVELEVFSNKDYPHRQGKFSARCRLATDFCELLFDIDCFDKKADAEEWARVYFEYLESIGINIKII